MQQEQLKKIVFQYKDHIYRLALSIMKNQAEAEDVLQDVFIRCWEKRHKLKDETKIKAYLMQTTRNRCLDLLKKSSKNQEINATTYYEQSFLTCDNYDEKEKLKLVESLINQLPEINQTILHLRETEQLEYTQIARITDLKIENVRTILSRTRKTLKKQVSLIYEYKAV